MTDYYKRGDIIIVNFDPVIGSEQGGIRPALVIQNDIGNKYSHTIIVAAISTAIKPELPTHISLEDIDFLDLSSTLLLEQIRTIDLSRVFKYIGRLTSDRMLLVDYALSISVGLDTIT